ncbi:MAG: PD-(D/E)XK nuclease family protein, partial [Patescibacteria group bacterium]|nr:PD-(D/E)XK nuclease family protein [Patescibacteria group bacterium]
NFPSPLFEVGMSRREKFGETIEVEVTGHADVLARDGAEIRCLDWKSGWLDTDHKPQIRTYALLAFTEFPEAETFWGSALRLRTGDMEPYKWTREEIETWWANALREISRMAYNQGDWCQYCPRARECPANLQDLEVSGKLLAGIESFTPEQLPAIYRARQVYQKLIDRAGDAIKAMVSANGGAMQFADCQLKILSEERQAIEPTQASLDLIAGAIPNVWPVLKITKSSLETEVRAVAPPRMGAKHFRELMTALERAGAVKKTIIEKLELKRLEEK